MPNESFWILLTAQHITETYIQPEGDSWQYEISPNISIKKGDRVYLWSNIAHGFFGWGEIIEHPRDFLEPEDSQFPKRRRQRIVVSRKEIEPPITVEMLQQHEELKKIIPTGFDNLYAIPLRPGQANYLNDFIRQLGRKAPSGSSTIEVYKHQPQLISELGDFSEKEKLVLSYHYVDRVSVNEIAEFWNEPVKIIEQRLETALRKLLSFRETPYLDKIEGKTLREQELPVSLIEIVETIKSLTPDLIQHLKQNEDDFQKLKPIVFEHLVGELLLQRGFDEVKLVGQDSSTSADILAVKKIHEIDDEVRYFIEVKRWKKKIGIEVINNVYGAMLMEKPNFGWNAAMIVSLVGNTDTRKVTPETLTRLNITLKKKDDLLHWLKEYEPKGNGLWLPKNEKSN